jgi:hypothetical protein
MGALGRAAGVVLLFAATSAPAHIVVGAKTLRQLVGESDLVLRARILEVDERVGFSTEGSAASRPSVHARVLEVLDGDLDAQHVRFAQHGHGVATFVPGEEVLVFLQDIARTRELRVLGEAGALAWVSLQEHEERFPLRPETREALLRAVDAYVEAGSAHADARRASLRTATLALLTAPDAHLAASAIRDLVLAPDAPLVTAQDVPALRGVLADPTASMGVRTALLVELERRGLLEGGVYWSQWLSDATPARDRVTALRASRAADDPEVQRRARALVGDPDVEVAAAAVEALAAAPAAEAVPPLLRALEHGDGRVRYASIRALGRIATPAATAALRETAASHPDAATRRRASAELRKRPAAGPG